MPENELEVKLDRIIKMLAFWMTDGKAQLEKIRILSTLGFRPTEIAGVLGTTSNTVNVALSNIRKKKGRR